MESSARPEGLQPRPPGSKTVGHIGVSTKSMSCNAIRRPAFGHEQRQRGNAQPGPKPHSSHSGLPGAKPVMFQRRPSISRIH